MALKYKRAQKICEECKKEFVCKLYEDRRFCSHSCYWKSMKGQENPTRRTGFKYFCTICHKGFYRPKDSGQKYCSRECYLVDHSKNVKEIQCAVCGVSFRTSREAKGGKLFCSNKCYFIDHSMDIEETECPQCHTVFEQSANLSEKKTFCSQSCSNNFNTKQPDRNEKIGKTLREKYASGEKVCWSKGLTSENDDRLRKISIKILESYQFGEREPHNKGAGGPGPYCEEWKDVQYKKDIKERDDNECKNPDCWHTSDYLSLIVHHINYDKRDCKPTNLITACVSCNSRANSNKEYWKDLYSGIVNG